MSLIPGHAASNAGLAQTGRPRSVVILGAGQAGGEAAFRLRANGFSGAITLLGEEPFLPYQRPPLSKAHLLGDMAVEALFLRESSAFEAADIMVHTGARAEAIDRAAREIRLSTGERLGYDRLILAAGSSARRPGFARGELQGLHVLRSIADVARLRPEMRAGARLAVIGAGYIGLEVAAIARKLGLAVTVFEAADRPLARVAHPMTARFFRDLHETHGVRFEFSAAIAGIEGNTRVTGLRRADGSVFACDLALLGIGGIPESCLAEAAGLACDNGIVVDDSMRSTDPAIFAIGDCCRRPIPLYDRRMERLESVHNALESARIAAFVIAHEADPETPHKAPMLEAPWFWSDQYDVKLQIVGLSAGHDQIVLRGEGPCFTLFYLMSGRVLAADCINMPGDFPGARKLVQERLRVAPEILRDTSLPMKEILRLAAAPVAQSQ